ncbi:hypothetical protein Ga0466249_001397 [Sporomusaceae bacterium BoRhaA]|nr:hypothetical protein [Pelorhabdus rhamnosifermentans]
MLEREVKNMSIVVVGADHLGGIEKNLYSLGVTEITHVSARKSLTRSKLKLPKATALVLVLTDYVNHGTAAHVKFVAKAQDIPLVYAKRSWSSVEEKLNACHFFDVT